jgi:hypothetical protein
MSFPPNINEQIENVIHEIESEYQLAQGLILTEDDLKCLLYCKLSRISCLANTQPTIDHNIYASCIHTEISWFDQDGKLTIKPDLTILDPSNLSILHSVDGKLRLPSKQFNFQGNAILIELKFVKQKTGITDSVLRTIESDIQKINLLYSRYEGAYYAKQSLFSYFVIFNKTNNGFPKIQSFMQSKSDVPWFKILYNTGNVSLVSRQRRITRRSS